MSRFKKITFARLFFTFFLFFSFSLLQLLIFVSEGAASTTSVHLVKYASDEKTILAERNVDYQWMKNNLPVYGDGVIHYYHQGPVFPEEWEKVWGAVYTEKPYDIWDPTRSVNLKDKGAVKGTALKDLCVLAGGLAPGEKVKIKAEDGFSKIFPYPNVYTPSASQGPIVLCWSKDGQEVPDYSDGMQLIFFSQVTNGEGKYVFGNWDMRQSFPQEYWHFYETYPTTTGYTVKYVSEIAVYSQEAPPASPGNGAGSGGGIAVGELLKVDRTDPEDKALEVPVNQTITIVFNQEISAGEIFEEITLGGKNDEPKEINKEINKSIEGKTLTIKPKQNLKINTKYTVTIPARAIKDKSGNSLKEDYKFSFTTLVEKQIPLEETAIDFLDLQNHWAREAVAKLAGVGLIRGYPDGNFKPEKKVSRAEITVTLTRLLGLSPENERELRLFADAAAIPVWARGAIAAATKDDLIKGYLQDDGRLIFEAERPVSRSEMACLAVRIIKEKTGEESLSPFEFKDAGKIPVWAKEAFELSLAKGFIKGYPDNTLRPDNLVSRAEAALIIGRLRDLISKT
jgi:hypothetical protein